ncbi:hypothetical protein GGR56DRAFT_242367 [Xylariaceae sp. FL0804]|nr:hypothetical protein GGR56DRAFT_242367 [Xylariaceae sp. FL0804]
MTAQTYVAAPAGVVDFTEWANFVLYSAMLAYVLLYAVAGVVMAWCPVPRLPLLPLLVPFVVQNFGVHGLLQPPDCRVPRELRSSGLAQGAASWILAGVCLFDVYACSCGLVWAVRSLAYLAIGRRGGARVRATDAVESEEGTDMPDLNPAVRAEEGRGPDDPSTDPVGDVRDLTAPPSGAERHNTTPGEEPGTPPVRQSAAARIQQGPANGDLPTQPTTSARGLFATTGKVILRCIAAPVFWTVISVAKAVGAFFVLYGYSAHWAYRRLRGRSNDDLAVTVAIVNLATAVLYYLVLFDSAGTYAPEWSSILG